jgi:hypothetical protein
MALRLFGETAALRDFDPAYARLGVTTGHSAMSAQCPVCAKADTVGRFMSTRPKEGLHRRFAEATINGKGIGNVVPN